MQARHPHPRPVLLAALAALGLTACEGQPAEPQARIFRASTAAEPTPARGEAIVTMLGDSITAGYGLNQSQALPAQLQAALRADGLAVKVRAAGVNGDTTAGGLARVGWSVKDDSEVVVVALGGNDMLQGAEPAEVRDNLDGIIRKLKARGHTVVLAGMQAPPRLGAWATAYNSVFAEVADRHDVYFYPFLLDGVALDSRYNQRDGIHPNPAGARIIAQGLAPVVAAAVRKEPIDVTASVAEVQTP